jgi:ACR3 family arsenite efflux pump ArsB
MLFNKYVNLIYKNTTFLKINFNKSKYYKKNKFLYLFKYNNITHSLIFILALQFIFKPFSFFLFKGFFKKFLQINYFILNHLNKQSINNLYLF